MNKPKIRFSGYTEAWEQRKFNEVVEKYEDPVETPTEGYMRLGIRSHAKGTFHSYVEKGKELETAKMFRVAADKFIVNITFGWEHAVAITDEDDAGKLVSHRFPQYSFNKGMVPKFFRYLILDECFKHHLELSSPGGAGRNRVLKLSDMLEYKMTFPTEAEQNVIASYFDSLDKLITLHQRKCDQTKKLKKYMLQKMFPQNGELYPEIRFEGFTEAWEQRKCEGILRPEKGAMKIGPFGSALKKEFYTEVGVKVYAQENIFQEDFSIGNYYISDERYQTLKGCKLEAGDLVISMMGTIGACAIFPEDAEPGIMNSHLLRLQLKDDIYPEYIHQLLRDSQLIRKQIDRLSVGSIMSGLSSSVVQKLVFPVPCIEEQKKIAEFLVHIDNLITLHQRKCDDLKEIKKYMLQNMFAM